MRRHGSGGYLEAMHEESITARVPPRVLLLAESPYVGGINSHVITLARALRENGLAEPVLAVLSGKGPDRALFEMAERAGFSLAEIPVRGGWDFHAPALLRRFANDRGVALAHTHNYRATLLAAAGRLPVPMVVSSHGLVDRPLKIRFRQMAERLAVRGAGCHVVACSASLAGELAARGLRRDRLHVVRNGSLDPGPLLAKTEARRLLGLPEEGIFVLFAGRLAPEKGLHRLLPVMAGMPECRLLVVGDGPERNTLQHWAHDLSGRCVFAGFQADMDPWYAAADVVALPSLREAFPMVLVEAAARALPVVASRVGGVPEIVEDGVTGLLVPPDDADALSAALKMLAGDGPMRKSMGEAARERWRKHHTADRMALDMAEVYAMASGARGA